MVLCIPLKIPLLFRVVSKYYRSDPFQYTHTHTQRKENMLDDHFNFVDNKESGLHLNINVLELKWTMYRSPISINSQVT